LSLGQLDSLEELSPAARRELRAALLALADETPPLAEALRVARLERLLGVPLCRRMGIYPLPEGFRLSVVMPVYNEVQTLPRVAERLGTTGLSLELVIVDDGSTDGSRDILSRWKQDGLAGIERLNILFHERNRGKGAALKTGFAHCTGAAIVVQDADLEYDPQDWHALIQPIVMGQADAVYGSRFSHIDGPVQHYWHRWGNQAITRLTNWKSGRAMTDVETCYKVIRREHLQEIAPTLRERGFGIEIELTLKLARVSGLRFYERPISYVGRSWAQGKKIGWRDGVWALVCILRY
jgi:glycosyltransferase involved in cell wall biosynthesis